MLLKIIRTLLRRRNLKKSSCFEIVDLLGTACDTSSLLGFYEFWSAIRYTHLISPSEESRDAFSTLLAPAEPRIHITQLFLLLFSGGIDSNSDLSTGLLRQLLHSKHDEVSPTPYPRLAPVLIAFPMFQLLYVCFYSYLYVFALVL